MKKQLLTTSALVAAGMLGAPGLATAQTAPASQPIQITIGGYMYQFVNYVSQDNVNNGNASSQATTTAKPSSFLVNNDTEIYFQGKTTLANGISVALRVELEGNTEGDQIDESFAIVEGAFGRIEIGSTDGAVFKTGIHAPEVAAGIGVAGGYNTLLQNTVANPTKSPSLDSNINSVLPRFLDNDAEKISYYTPRFEGFQLGLSYAPELTQDRKNLVNGFNTSQAGVAYGRSFNTGLNFTRAFGPVDIAASAGYMRHQKMDNGILNNGSANFATFNNPHAYTLGAQIGYAGFRFGGSYLQQTGAVLPAAAATGAATNATGVGVTGATDTWLHGSSFDLGLSYTFGPAVVGVSYFNGKNRSATGTVGEQYDRVDAYEVAGRYQLGPGVQVQASVYHARIRGANYTSNSNATSDGATGINNNNATGVMTGLILNF